MAKDGGSAFPLHPATGTTEVTYDGMSLRDYFAAHALTGITAGWGNSAFTPPIMAARAYALADAMMNAREFATDS